MAILLGSLARRYAFVGVRGGADCASVRLLTAPWLAPARSRRALLAMATSRAAENSEMSSNWRSNFALEVICMVVRTR
jgi:hypothetical protein